MRRIRRAALALTLAAGSAVPAAATLVVPLSFEQMTDRSHEIVVGTCSSVRSYWEGSKIMTEARFRVQRRLKGGSEAELSLKQVGGTVQEPMPLSMRVAGAPSFEEGETDLLFLQRGADGQVRVMGLFQGRLRLQRDPASGAWRGESGERLADLLARIEARLKAAGKP